jgi:NADH-quinone oxidoreductase subunit N
MTIAMLSLAGFPATAGFFGKLYLIEAAVDNGYAWLGVVIVHRLGDLARLLPARGRGGVDALARRGGRPRRPRRARPAIAGGRPRPTTIRARHAASARVAATARRPRTGACASPRSSAVALFCAAANRGLRHLPRAAAQPRRDAGAALTGLF